MDEFADFVPAFAHHLKPPMRDGSQFPGMFFHPRINRGIALDSAVESQQFSRLHDTNLSSKRLFLSLMRQE
jgi:hypothetical protein